MAHSFHQKIAAIMWTVAIAVVVVGGADVTIVMEVEEEVVVVGGDIICMVK